MRSGLRGPVPWDIVVFLIVTVVGFGYTVQDFSRKYLRGRSAVGAAAPVDGLLDLGCIERKANPEKILAEMGPIRLRGKMCTMNRSSLREFDGIKIRNLANGHQATVYFQGNDATFVTDYITMNSGHNPIEVQWRASRDAAPERFTADVFER